MSKFYLTTPIYYINDKPHIGHAYTTIIADIVARYHRMKGEEVFFLTGTDENSQKNVETARRSGETDMRAYLDRMSALWRMTWDCLDLTPTDFIRTTDERHRKGVEAFFQVVNKRGDIYEGEYKGLYCVGCEAFVTEKELVGGLCPYHQKAPQKLKERNYFFRASRYREAILKHIHDHPAFIQPESRRNEVLAYLKDNFQDVSITRPFKRAQDGGGVTVGIPVPGDETQAVYVWFDALLNYLTAVGYGTHPGRFKQWWPADLHLVGKDIIKFHCALWPAMLLSAGLELPKSVFAHGFFTMEGQKISKSLGNIIDPIDLQREYGNEALRYFLAREIRLGEDGDFSLKRLSERYEAELVNGLGNTVRRVLTLALRLDDYWNDVPIDLWESDPLERELAEVCERTWTWFNDSMTKLQPYEALEAVWEFLTLLDHVLERTQPWKTIKISPKETARVLVGLLEALRQLAWMLWSFMPATSEQIWSSLGLAGIEQRLALSDACVWGGLNLKELTLSQGDPLFPRKW